MNTNVIHRPWSVNNIFIEKNIYLSNDARRTIGQKFIKEKIPGQKGEGGRGPLGLPLNPPLIIVFTKRRLRKELLQKGLFEK